MTHAEEASAAATAGEASKLALQSCIRWLSLTLDTGPASPEADEAACADSLARLRTPEATGQSLMAALADGRLLDRLLLLVGLPAEEAPACASDGAAKFVAWCRHKFPAAVGPGPDISADTVVRCLHALANWENASESLPSFEWPQLRAATYADMLEVPVPKVASPIEAELARICTFYRVTNAVAGLLTRSPLSYWPAEEMRAAFRFNRRLLAVYSQIRRELRRPAAAASRDDDEKLEAALRTQASQLGGLHACQMSQWQLISGPAVRQLVLDEPRRARQVRWALKQLMASDDWSRWDMEQLQLAPAFQVRGLLKRLTQMCGDDRGHREALKRSKVLISELDSRLTTHLERLETQVKPSLTALRAISGSLPDNLRLENLGVLRHEGLVALEDDTGRWNCRGYLWDGGLVLVDPANGAFLRTVAMTMDVAFLPHLPDPAGATLRLQQQRKLLLLLVLNSREDCRAWLDAATAAKDARHPRGNDYDGHSFRQVFFGPETLADGCFRCQRPLVGFNYTCGGPCGLRLDHTCIRTLRRACSRDSGAGGTALPPMPKPRGQRMLRHSDSDPVVEAPQQGRVLLARMQSTPVEEARQQPQQQSHRSAVYDRLP